MTILEAAVAYGRLGYRIFPCDPHAEKPRSKRPLVVADKDADGKPIEGTGWPLKASCNEAQIRAWWKRWPDALIGMAPGWAGGYVVDLDPKGESVEAVEARLAEAIGGALPAGPRTITQSGGRHVWFRRPEGAHWPNDPPGLKNIDIRCDAGYVILPPSVMRNGNAYSWEGVPFDPATAPEVPPALLALIANRKAGKREAGPADTPEPQESGPARALASDRPGEVAKRNYARKALDRIAADLARAAEGTRGTELYAAACALGRFIAAGAISEREAMAALEDGAEACGLVLADGRPRVLREIQRGLGVGRADAADVIARLDDIAREAESRQRPSGGGVYPPEAPLPDGAIPEPSRRREARSAPAPMGGDEADPDGSEPYSSEPADDADGGDDGPSDGAAPGTDMDVVAACARLDHSDTDNAKRFVAHFGRDLTVLETEGIINTDYCAWAGTHWDMVGGNDAAVRLAKQVGGLIGLEADLLAATAFELRAMEDGDQAEEDLARLEKSSDSWTDADKAQVKRLQRVIDAGAEARAALDKRRVARRKFGVSSKNKARIVALKDLAACDLTRKPEGFNADPRAFACLTHTIQFGRRPDPECPDPDVVRLVPYAKTVKGHRREDFITKVLPVAYDKDAKAPRFEAFMARFLPIEAVRRCVQVGAGLGLLGLPVQKVFFHYGNGANGKSVFLETLVRVFGALASSLPTEAIIGTNDKQGGAASPELARLYGVRFVRVVELPANVPLREDVVKKLTGGETIPVRNLFKGFFEFRPVFIAHMSGNGYPKIDGTDNGIWRRIAVIHWPIALEDSEQRDFEEVVGELAAEAPGILNWLIEGALTYLREGLILPPEVRAATQEYRDEMDVVGQFVASCVEPAPGMWVTARAAYRAYADWSDENGKKPVTETRFGRDMKRKLQHGRNGAGVHVYQDCRLVNLPDPISAPRSPDDDR
ncbi:putative DNA primase/helicase [Xanthobacter sp. SG618]|uniref:phage/plasmid primase, P4 family n=1 Tax=Xanthobacter sp. SG618 TaxID=2587121 RepID=UPI00145F0A9A|nr:phage/plasmid primase, P4 family [Xanthobacter sp. SG618]NMN56882.1 putative DNA primase/helicase [Xanthobacter sp. SG618]